MKKENTWSHVEWIITIVIFLGAASLYFYRIFWGAEITDECFSISEAYITVKGAVPISDTWSQSPTFVILMYPFIKLFLIVTGGSTAGIILYGRCLFFLFKLVIVLSLFLLLRKEVKPVFLAIAGSAYIMEQGFNIFTFSYGTGSVAFLIMSDIFLAFAFSSVLEEKNSKKCLYYTICAGLCACACAVAHPSQILYCIASVILLFLAECRTGIKHRISFCYTISGGLFAFVIFFSLLLKRGLKGFLYGIDMVLNQNPYFALEENNGSILTTINRQLYGIWDVLQFNIRWTIGIAFLGIAVCVIICWRKKSENHGRLNINSGTIINIFLASYGVSYVYLFFRQAFLNGAFAVSEQYLTLPAAFILPFYLIYKKDIPTRLKWFCFFAEISSCCWIFNAGILALGGYSSRCYSLMGAVMAYILLNLYYFAQIFYNKIRYLAYTACFCIFCLLFMGIGSNLYGYVYREAPLKEMNYKISSGVYKGLYTTQERAEGLLEIEDTIRKITDKKDNVLFMEVVPFAYLMTEANACTPSTWDISLYSYGFNYDVQYRSYFTVMNCIPDKIIYIDTGRDDHLSIDEPEYRFNEFVNKNYTLKIRIDDAYYPVRMYERKMTKSVLSQSAHFTSYVSAIP